MSSDQAGATPERGPMPDFGSLPWYRNPFVIAFIAGAITLTWLQFRLRYEPDPPPPMGELEVIDWTGSAGASFRDPFVGRVTVVAFADSSGSSCGGIRLVSKLRHMFADDGLDVRVAVVAPGVSRDDKAWDRIRARFPGERSDWWTGGPSTVEGADALHASLEAAWGPHETWRTENPRPPAPVELVPPPQCDGPRELEHVALVGPNGRIRGFYPAWGWDVESEILHRAEHVLDESAER